MEDNPFKKVMLTVAAATALNGAEAQSTSPSVPTHDLSTEQSVSPKTDWAKDLATQIDSMNDLHDVRDIYAVMQEEKNILNVIKGHLNAGKGTYTRQDYSALLAYYQKINNHFEDWEQKLEEKYAPEGDPERALMLTKLEHLAGGMPHESEGKQTAMYPGRVMDDGGSQ